MNEYQSLKEGHEIQFDHFSRKYNQFSIIRLIIALSFIGSMYLYFRDLSAIWLLPAFLLSIIFFIVVNRHQKIERRKKLEHQLVLINKNEAEYISKGALPFEDGQEFSNSAHFFSYDLDLFGPNSLFQHLNRTGTYLGKKVFGSYFLNEIEPAQISERQHAIDELASQVQWRQTILAQSQIQPDDQESYDELLKWVRIDHKRIPLLLKISSYVLPLITITCFALYFLTPMAIMGNIGLILFLVNLGMLGTQFQRIRSEIVTSTEIDKILRQYAINLNSIEEQSFKSKELNRLKDELTVHSNDASLQIHKLSKLFARMDHVQNVFAGPLLNGLFQYHIHTLAQLDQWKIEYAQHIEKWLSVIANFEALNSLANFAHNNPEYTNPSLNDQYTYDFEDLGHPLIPSSKRVINEVSFDDYPFFILTGSNMSGKSTFLRTLGVNLVLGKMGAPMCASKATFHPLPLLVSMRLSDSLADSESYFFAEVKRLRNIMKSLDDQKCFVLLDEILRGTNSDDKRTGTIEVVRKMVEKGAIGAIATHDLEVCNVANEFTNELTNRCFEVEIVDNELHFDYKLREGVCKNKSATFLMEKMGVI